MKTFLTLIFVLFISVSAQANNGSKAVKVETIATSITKEVSTKNENQVARLYMFKNANIKKALAFSTKLNKAKLA